MKCFELMELAALRVTGALDQAGSARLEAMLAADPGAADEVAALSDAMAAYAQAVARPRVPPSTVRASIMAKIGFQPQFKASATNKPGFTFVSGGEPGWVSGRVPGLRFKLLSASSQGQYRVMVIELAPGARLPRHVHRHGAESVYVLSGDLLTEGRLMRAGDFLHSAAGTDHDELQSIEGCRALVFEPVEGADFELDHPHQ